MRLGVILEAGDGHALHITVLVNPVMLALTQLHKAYAQTLDTALRTMQAAYHIKIRW